MPRIIFCKKYQKELEGLDFPPMPGPLGEEIFDTISKLAWQDWMKQQTMLINEKHLNMMNMDDRKYLNTQMDKFLNNEQFEQAEGYTPIKK